MVYGERTEDSRNSLCPQQRMDEHYNSIGAGTYQLCNGVWESHYKECNPGERLEAITAELSSRGHLQLLNVDVSVYIM